MMLQYQVPDMSCDHCVRTISQAVHAVAPAASVRADLPSHRVIIDGTQDAMAIEQAIRKAGYSPTPA